MALRSTAWTTGFILLAAASLHAQRPTDQLAWLSGCWEMHGRNASITHEMWLPPAGGMLLGVSRTVRGDSVIEFESLRIHEDGNALVFTAHPSGQSTAEFRAPADGSPPITFENLAHDFPQRIIYRPAGADSVIARIEGIRDDTPRGVDFRYKRMPCTKP